MRSLSRIPFIEFSVDPIASPHFFDDPAMDLRGRITRHIRVSNSDHLEGVTRLTALDISCHLSLLRDQYMSRLPRSRGRSLTFFRLPGLGCAGAAAREIARRDVLMVWLSDTSQRAAHLKISFGGSTQLAMPAENGFAVKIAAGMAKFREVTDPLGRTAIHHRGLTTPGLRS